MNERARVEMVPTWECEGDSGHVTTCGSKDDTPRLALVIAIELSGFSFFSLDFRSLWYTPFFNLVLSSPHHEETSARGRAVASQVPYLFLPNKPTS